MKLSDRFARSLPENRKPSDAKNGFGNQKTTTISTQLADSYNQSNSTVKSSENVGNATLNYGGDKAANLGLILAGGLVLIGLGIALK